MNEHSIVDTYTLHKIQGIIHEAKYEYDLAESKKHGSLKKYLISKLDEIFCILENIRIRDRGEGDVKRRDEVNAYLREERSKAGSFIKDGIPSFYPRPLFPVIEGAEYQWIGDGDYFVYIPLSKER